MKAYFLRKALFLVQCIFILVALLPSCEEDDPIVGGYTDPNNIAEKLKALPGIKVTELESWYAYQRVFRIDITQPIDHQNPEGPTFKQRMYLTHVGEDLPMVFNPSGYEAWQTYVQELSGIMRANNLHVAHRYFEDAEPTGMDWQYLTIKQAAADHHRIVELFKEIYKGKWISSGVSKGGSTCLFHKRYYPEDVDATIAYVAPISLGAPDNRYIDYLASIGTEECRAAIHNFQRRCLINRDSLVPRINTWLDENDYNVYGDIDVILEGKVCSYKWTFWQYHYCGCNSIPDEDATYDEMISHLIQVTNLHLYTKDFEYSIRPYLYQAYSEFGYPGKNYDHLMDLLKYFSNEQSSENIEYYGMPIIYDDETIIDINEWLINHGDNIIYIYGRDDPWTGGAIELEGNTNALKIVHESGDHRVKIKDLNEKELVLNTLSGWLDIEEENFHKGYRLINSDLQEYKGFVFF